MYQEALTLLAIFVALRSRARRLFLALATAEAKEVWLPAMTADSAVRKEAKEEVERFRSLEL